MLIMFDAAIDFEKIACSKRCFGGFGRENERGWCRRGAVRAHGMATDVHPDFQCTRRQGLSWEERGVGLGGGGWGWGRGGGGRGIGGGRVDRVCRVGLDVGGRRTVGEDGRGGGVTWLSERFLC